MAPSAEPILTCLDLACGYSESPVLDQIGFQVGGGEIIALLGPNGSGKSTLLKTLCGTIRPLSGAVILGGDNLNKLSGRELGQRVAFVPQEEESRFPFSVTEIVAMGRMPYSQGLFESKKDHEVIAQAMQEADCQNLADRPIDEISGGERQRVLIARALAQEAPILLLDEPAAHLDVAHQLTTAALLRQLASRGKCIIAAAHDLNWASIVADRALLLYGGRVGLDEPIGRVLESPEIRIAYGVDFDSSLDSNGRIRVFARSLHPMGTQSS